MSTPIGIRRTVRLRLGGGAHGIRYRVAGVDIESDLAIGLLEPFSRLPSPPGGDLPGERLDVASPVSERRVEARATESGHRVSIEGLGTFVVDPTSAGASVRHEPAAAGEPGGLAFEEAVVGPVLALALAECGVFCLHASAVELDGRVLAIAGDSAAGKSTLAAAVERMEGPARRVADDILPLARASWSPSATVALPRFPQLKLAAGVAHTAASPEALPLVSVVVLEPRAGPGHGSPAGPLAPADAVAELLRHGVADRLFGPRLTAERFGCAVAAAEGGVEVWRLATGRASEELPRQVEAVLDLLAAAGTARRREAVAG